MSSTLGARGLASSSASIYVFEDAAPGEVWVQVTSAEPTPDFPTVRRQLPAHVAHLPLDRFVPGSAVAGEWAFEDWFILRAAE